MNEQADAIARCVPRVLGCNKPNNAHVYSVASNAASIAMFPLNADNDIHNLHKKHERFEC
jgi:hypothetical protein